MAGISSKAAGPIQNKEKTFQGQRFDDDLGLNWVQFKWRNHDPQIGRFIEIDPLAEDYVYNSTYAFSENKVTNHVELEGLEAVSAGSVQGWLGSMFSSIASGFASAVDKVYSITLGSGTKISTPTSTTTNFVTTASSETTYGTNLLGWLESSKAPNSTVNTGPSLFKSETKTTAKAEIESKVDGKVGSVATAVSVDGTSTRIEAKVKTKFEGLPADVSLSSTKNYNTGDNSTKLKAAVGPPSLQVFGQVELSTKKNTTTPIVAVGVQVQKEVGKSTVTQSVYIKKAF